MATAEVSKAPINPDAMMTFAFKVVGDLAAAMNGPLVYMGDRLGIFKTLAASGPLTASQIADKCNLNERYVREWCSAMTAGEYLKYDPAARTFTLPPEHAMVLANEDSPVFAMGFAQMIPEHYRLIPRIIHHMQHGGGVPYADYGEDTFVGTERFFGPGYKNFLATQWIPAMPEVHEKLKAGCIAADVGCGRGAALREMAKAFPTTKFTGLDNYAPGVDYANAKARELGLENLQFEVCSSNTLPQGGKFDLIMTCDCVHDMVSPEACARSIFGAMKDDGTWFAIEPNIKDKLEENINPVGKAFYSVSMLQCMSCSLAHGGAGYGAGMGEANMRRITELAGFTRFRRLPIDNPFNQFFEIRK